MTVQNNVARNQYTATAGQTVFTYTFEIADPTSIAVYKRASTAEPHDATNLLTYLTDYTLTGVGVETGGTVVLVVGAALNNIITIESNVIVERDSSFTPGGLIKAEDLNDEFDNVTLIEQKIQTIIEKLIPKYPFSAAVLDRDLVLPILGQDEVWRMNLLENKIEPIVVSSEDNVGTLRAELASHAHGQGASMIGLEGEGTVQDLSNSQFIVNVPSLATPNAQALGNLATGILRSTTSTGVVSISAALTSIDTLTTNADQMLYTTATDTYATTSLTPFARGLLGDPNGASALVTLGALPLAGGTMTGDLFLNRDPTFGLQAATMQWVLGIAFNVTPACLVSTTANLAGYSYSNGTLGVGAKLTAGSNGVFTADGVTPAVGSRIFVPFQTAQAQNGIYTLTTSSAGVPAVLTRATDYDEASDMQAGDQISIVSGTLYKTSVWMMTQTNPITVGTTTITWQQSSSPTGALLASNNLSDLSNPSIARTNLGVAIGTDVQAFDATLQSLSALGTTADRIAYTTGVDTWAETPLTAFARSILDDVDAAALRVTLDAASRGANSDITSMSGLTGTLRAPTQILDASGNAVLAFNSFPSAVNYLTIYNAAAAGAALIQSAGASASIPIAFQPKNADAWIQDPTNTIASGVRFYNAASTFYTRLGVATAQATTLNLTLPAADGTANQCLVTNGSGVLSFKGGDPVVQRVNFQTGAVSTGTTVMPFDDTIPQITEGNEYMTLAITPKSASNILKIEAIAYASSTAPTGNVVVIALFQDATANALAAIASTQLPASGGIIVLPPIFHTKTAGTTSATTFRIRIGATAAGTTTFNGSGGARTLGGVMASSITITEYTS